MQVVLKRKVGFASTIGADRIDMAVDIAVAIIEIWEEENSAFATIAGGCDIPFARNRLERHRRGLQIGLRRDIIWRLHRKIPTRARTR
jgi:hypothetical protein